MPIFSRRYSLWTRLYDRMLLEPTPDARVTPMVSEVVVPILDADALLQTPTLPAQVSKDISGTAYVPYFTVPAGEEWELIQGSRGGTTGTTEVTIKISGNTLRVSDHQTAGENFDLRDIILREDDSIGMLGTDNGGDTSRNMTILYNSRDLA